MSIQAQSADGVVHEFPDGTPDAVVDRVMKTYATQKAAPAKPAANPIVDAAKSLGSGIAEGFTALPGIVGDVENAWGNAVDAAGHKVIGGLQDLTGNNLGAPYMGSKPGAADPKSMDYAILNGHVTGRQLNEARQKVVGQDYQPQTMAGRVARTVGNFAPNALLPGSMAARAGMVLGPGIGSEWAGQAAQGTPYEGAARVAGAMAGGVGAGLVTGPRAALPAAAPSKMNDLLGAFEQAGVRPTLAASGGRSTAAITQAIAENPVAGFRVRPALRGAIDDTAASAGRTASKYGQPVDPKLAGEAVQEGVKNFAKGTGAQLPPDLVRQLPSSKVTFGDKASALYTRAERLIQTPDAPIFLRNTVQALQNVVDHFADPNLGARFANPTVDGIASDLIKAGGRVSWDDAAKLRTAIRERLKADPTLGGTISDAQINSIYDGLTSDLEAGAAQLGGARAASAWKQANSFYRAGRQRIDKALTNFVGKDAATPAGEAVYDRILKAAGERGGADAGRLYQLKKALPADQWGDIAATAVDRMGRATPGAADVGPFSISRFATNYSSLSPQGKALLFGGGPLRAELENLNRVVGAQKGIERAANTSNTGSSMQAVGTVAGLANPATTIGAAKVLGTLALTGEAMTNPAVVRTIARMSQAASNSPAAFRSELGRLRIEAQRNAALLPIYEQLAALPAPTSLDKAMADQLVLDAQRH